MSFSPGNGLNFQAPQQNISSNDRIDLERQLQLVSTNRIELEREQLKVFTDTILLDIEKKRAGAEAELELKRQEIILLRRNDAPSGECIKLQEDYAALKLKVEAITTSCKLEINAWDPSILSRYTYSNACCPKKKPSIWRQCQITQTIFLEATTLVVEGN